MAGYGGESGDPPTIGGNGAFGGGNNLMPRRNGGNGSDQLLNIKQKMRLI